MVYKIRTVSYTHLDVYKRQASGMFLPGQCYQFIHISCCGMHPFRSQGIQMCIRDRLHSLQGGTEINYGVKYTATHDNSYQFYRDGETGALIPDNSEKLLRDVYKRQLVG